ncbi:HAD family hydrolase [Bacillus sp. ISL-77]|uniref:HAD family hydrolase n=1 Tax=Bacillus sp. ISL-77 TaxID=2819138 RepID=UPI001BE93EB1|nr:HAD family hydrolase [Bacillus sp. ISL-77]MBT2742608.1 HAD family hydrolase [Bacillus sp. ISL-77]
MQKQNILFNLDDTLVYCNRYFNQVIEMFADQMTTWFDSLTKEEIKQKQLEIDLESINEHGLTSDRFPESFVGTYKYFCDLTGKEKEKSDIEFFRELGFKVFKIPVEPLPYMNETLQRLKEAGHELYLHTGGDEPNQRRKIIQLELTTYFEHRIFISEHKDTTALSDILKTIKADPKITWMVGDSLRTDIVPALKMNINAIYIPAETEWKYNVVEVKVEPKRAFFTLNSLQEVPDAIHKHILVDNQFRNNLPSNYDSHDRKKEKDNLYT